jgi:hypothetical protein
VAVSFIGGGNQSTWRKPPTYRKSLTTLSHNVVSSTPCHEQDQHSKVWFQLTKRCGEKDKNVKSLQLMPITTTTDVSHDLLGQVTLN